MTKRKKAKANATRQSKLEGNKEGMDGRRPRGKKGKKRVEGTHQHHHFAASNGGRKKTKGGKTGNLQSFDDDDFRTKLQQQGHTINEMIADGNCLFRSLSDQLYNDRGNRHDVVRQEVCNYLDENEDEFSVFLIFEDEEDVQEFDKYVGKMREDGEWGGNVELVAAARLYSRSFTIFSPSGAFSIESGNEEESGDNIMLSYHDNGHYNSIIGSEGIKPIKMYEDIEEASSGVGKRRESKSNIAKKKRRAENLAGTEAMKSSNDSFTGEEVGDKRDEHIRSNIEIGGNGSKALRRNDPCPCGSGLRYKKCCLAIEKSRARSARWKEKNGESEDATRICDGDESDWEHEMEGHFRILKI